MKAIKIVDANADKIEAVLKEVNGKAHQHSFTIYEEIRALAEEAEKEAIKTIGAKKLIPGVTYYAESGGSVATAYKYTRLGTEVVLERRSSAWYLIEAAQSAIWASGGGRRLYLTPAQDEAAVEHLRKGYSVESGPNVETHYRISDPVNGEIGWFSTYEIAKETLDSYNAKRGWQAVIKKTITTTKSGFTTVTKTIADETNT